MSDPIRSVGKADAAAFEAVLVGDSVVGLLAGGRKEGVRRGLETEAFASLGCIQVATNRLRLDDGRIIELSGCEDHQRRWRSFVEAASPRWVLLLDGWQGGLEREVDGIWLDPCAPAFALAYEAGLGTAIELIRRSDSRPVILTAPPPTGDDLTDAIKAAAGGRKGGRLIDRLNEETACQNVVRRRVADAAGVPVIDLAERVCPKGVSLREIDGVLLRSDGVHFRDAGAEIIASWLLDQVASLR